MFKDMHDFQLIREITFQRGDKSSPGNIQIGGLEWDEENDVWGCKCSITFLHDEIISLHGVDAMHALQECFQFIAGLIAGAEKDGVDIWWLEPGDHCDIGWEKPNPV
jgi:Domain of unknown function (DUF6968)